MKVEAQKANWAYDKHEFKKMQSPQRLICEMKAQIALSCRQMVGSQPLLYWHVMFPSVCVGQMQTLRNQFLFQARLCACYHKHGF